MWHSERSRSLSNEFALLALIAQEQPAHKIFSQNYEKVSLNPRPPAPSKKKKKNMEVFHPGLAITAQVLDIAMYSS